MAALPIPILSEAVNTHISSASIPLHSLANGHPKTPHRAENVSSFLVICTPFLTISHGYMPCDSGDVGSITNAVGKLIVFSFEVANTPKHRCF
jgi:hypothetical protein